MPEAITQGETIGKALENLKDAIQLRRALLKHLKEHDCDLRRERTRHSI